MSVPSRTGHLPALDGLRAVAVLAVLWHHAWGRRAAVGGVEAAVRTVSEAGWMGVDLFFVLSGFLITRLLIRHRDAPNLLRAFWWRRALRILPAYYAFLGVIFVLLPAIRVRIFAPGPLAKLAYATFLSNVWIADHGLTLRQPTHLWSVAVEEQFYLLWPFVVLWAPGPWLGRVIVGLLLATPFARSLATLGGVDHLALYALTPFRLDGLGWGALLAVAEASPGGLARWRPLAAVGALVATTAAITWTALHGALRPDLELPVYQAALYAFTGMGFASVVTLVLTQPDDHVVNRWLTRPWMQAVGRWSYMIYLLHPVVLIALRLTRFYPLPRHQHAWWYVPAMTGFTALGAAVTLALAAASWRWLEAPLLRRKDRVPYVD
ncbi:MAG: acyltransferase [Alphaproteobacteria bacterium]|nr:acyltransferase [Alphaproteobacteria bacterium]